MVKRLLVGASAAVVALVMAASPALAHFCSVANRSAQGTESAQHSDTWLTFREAAPLFVCPAGATYFITTADAQNLDIDTPFNTRAVMAGGAFFKGKDVPGITHADYLFPLFGAAEALCA